MKNYFDEFSHHDPRVKKSIKQAIIILGIFFGGFIAWSYLAPLETAVVVPGKVVLKTNRKTIEHLEGGIIKKIYIHEGDFVKKGAALFKLDDTIAKANYQAAFKEVNALLAHIAMLKARRDNLNVISFPPRLTKLNDPDSLQLLQLERAQFQTEQDAFSAQLKIYQQQISQLQQQIDSIYAQVRSNDQQIALITKEATAIGGLVEKHLVEKPRLWALQREAARLGGNRGEQLGQVAEAKQKINGIEQEIVTLKENSRKAILEDLSATQNKLALAIEKEKTAINILQRTLIVAPQTGVVVGLQEHTIGGVITPGKPLLDLVPSKDQLIIEVRIDPMDVEALHPGLTAKVQLVAFKRRNLPWLEGKVLTVSADNLLDEKTGQAYFTARILIPPQRLPILNQVKLYPGMPVQVMIITGKRTAISYLFLPLIDSFNKAFHEK